MPALAQPTVKQAPPIMRLTIELEAESKKCNLVKERSATPKIQTKSNCRRTGKSRRVKTAQPACWRIVEITNLTRRTERKQTATNIWRRVSQYQHMTVCLWEQANRTSRKSKIKLGRAIPIHIPWSVAQLILKVHIGHIADGALGGGGQAGGQPQEADHQRSLQN